MGIAITLFISNRESIPDYYIAHQLHNKLTVANISSSLQINMQTHAPAHIHTSDITHMKNNLPLSDINPSAGNFNFPQQEYLTTPKITDIRYFD